MGFFGIGEGPSGHEIQQNNLLNSASSFATGLGEGNLTLSSEFFRNLLTDPTKALAPEISAGQKQGEQQKKTNAEFGTRSGGTAGFNQSIDSTNRGNIINLMGSTQTGAAGELSLSGTNLLNTGISGTETSFDQNKIMHDQSMQGLQDLATSILSTVGGAVASVPGSPGGFQDVASNLLNGGGS